MGPLLGLVATCVSSLDKRVVKSCVHFEYLAICYFITELLDFFMYSRFKFLVRYLICKYFITFCDFFLHGIV